MDNKRTAVFKTYSMKQQMLLPPSLDELVSPDHLARVVDETLNKIDTRPLLAAYPGGGASSYHPVMMLKILVFAYAQKIYSCRQIAASLHENVTFMWLSGGNTPDFRTINRFRSGPLKETLEKLFTSLTEHLIQEGHVSMKNYFLDGTKIEANAGRYTWVWKRATDKFSMRLSKQIKDLWDQIDEINDEEDRIYGDRGYNEPLPSEKPLSEIVDELSRKINEKLKEKPEDKELKKVKKKIDKDYKPRAEKYDDQLTLFNGRNSYSKTDTDATFMRMKEDAMKNGQLKPGYNVQIGTENQFVLAYSVHHNPGDFYTFIPHMEMVKEQFGVFPERVIADSGYGNEENYDFCDSHGIEKSIKFSYFHKEQKRKYKKDKFNKDNWPYDPESDTYFCPQDKEFNVYLEREKATASGYKYKEKLYAGPGCRGCPERRFCCRGSGDRRIQRRDKWEQQKTEVRDFLLSEEGVRMRSLRPIEPETVFGQVKNNMGFKRFHLRGKDKVTAEWGLVSMAHNLRKLANIRE